MNTKSKRKRTGSIIVLLIATILVIATVLLVLYYKLPGTVQVPDAGKFKASRFSNRDEVDAVLNDFRNYYKETYLEFFSFGTAVDDATMDEDAVNMSPAPGASKGDSLTGAGDYSTTNVQVDGIDESDIVKTDGEYIYYLKGANGYSDQSKILIVKADGENTSVTASINPRKVLGGSKYTAYGIYLYGDKLILEGEITVDGKYYASFAIFDISNKSAPVLERSVAQQGSLVSSRFKQGKMYYVVNCNANNSVPCVNDTFAGVEGEMDVENIYWFDGIPTTVYTTIGVIDIDNPEFDAYKSYLGAGSDVYVSEDNIYIATADYSKRYLTNGLRYWYSYEGAVQTRVLKFSITDLTCLGGNEVDGYIKDRYSMDEYDNTFRIATSVYGVSTSENYNKVYVMDKDMALIGESECFGKGERIYSARFYGTTASIVTFRETDPLFKIDLSDPANIKVSEGLEKEGVSMYLHNVEGTDYIIGLGRHATTNGTLTGIEVVLFDNSGDDATIINKIVYGSYGYADALYDPRAILYDKDYDMIAFSASISVKQGDKVLVNGIEYEYPETYGTYYAIFGFMDGEIYLKGAVVLENEDARGVRIGNYLYVLNDIYLTVHDISENFERVSSELLVNG